MLLSLMACSITLKIEGEKNDYVWIIDKKSVQQTISIPTKSSKLNKRASLLIYLSLNLIFNSLIEWDVTKQYCYHTLSLIMCTPG